MKTKPFFYIILIFLFSCGGEATGSYTEEGNSLFAKIHSSQSNIHFTNTVEENNYFNFLNYSYIYNGGGVAVGDINNDDLVDIYFTSNQQSNKLYLNIGGFVFDDITTAAHVGDEVEGWTTGVSMIDINNDGYLDIYVCKSGLFNDPKLRANKLFINQQDNTFKEEAEKYGLADSGFSTQAYFFDFDKDGDLDMYLVNHRPDFQNNTVIDLDFQKKIFIDGSDRLFRNDNNHFVNISEQAGVLSKTWGLSASIGDFNNDDWPDIYVTNDFLEPDFLYINNQDGTFTDRLQENFNHISSNSMGSDFADINNDLYSDLLVLDMSPEDHIRSKNNMPSMSTENFNLIVNSGYHYQYMQNTLQLNNGNNTFSEIALMTGLAKTDWSWSPLIADFDNDGWKDVFVTNGILHELNNQDFRTKIKARIASKQKMDLEEAISMMPSKKTANYIYKNNRDLTFTNNIERWGLEEVTYSNGAAYADLDNDGDLDLIINNMDDEAGIYKNNAQQNYIQIKLQAIPLNHFAIGTEVIVKSGNLQQSQSLYPNRGYQSSVDYKLTFGLSEQPVVDSIIIKWPNGENSILTNQKANQLIEIDFTKMLKKQLSKPVGYPDLQEVAALDIGIDYQHKENVFDDFQEQILLPHSQSKNGPFITTADVNNDGLIDFFIGGALNQAGELYVQQNDGKFKKQTTNTFIKDKKYEDLGALFFDADNDADQDLYIVSGGAEFPQGSDQYQDRLYTNDGLGNFTKAENTLPKMLSSGQVVIANDVDGDGDMDIFVGGRIIPDKYPYSPKSYLLINEKGVFKHQKQGEDFEEMGLISDAVFSDFDNDGDQDLLAVGEWTSIQVFENKEGRFTKLDIPILKATNGLWFSIAQKDIDNDGDIDYFVGNLGLNAKFKAKFHPFQIFCDDFDQNGTYDVILTNNYKGTLVPLRGKECTSQQIPTINNKFKTYNDFARADLDEILGAEHLKKALHLSADIFYSVYLENKGDGDFNVIKLPNELQIAPIFGFEFMDINKNGKDEIISIGNLYSTEVETVRYDASYGNVLSFIDTRYYSVKTPKFRVFPFQQSGFSVKGDAKNIKIINMGQDRELIFILKNNEKITIYQ